MVRELGEPGHFDRVVGCRDGGLLCVPGASGVEVGEPHESPPSVLPRRLPVTCQVVHASVEDRQVGTGTLLRPER
eukprot:scaffold12168_cov86-Isochrysis_galbana.AAC.3